MASNPELELLRELQQRHAELRAEMAALLERSRAIREEIAQQHAESLVVERQMRAANRAALKKADELMEAARRIGSLSKTDSYLAGR